MVLAIATPAMALIWEPHTPGFAGCPGSGQVLWEFTEPGCMPTSDVADPPYFFDPDVPNPTFGTSYTDGGPVVGWTWSGGVYTVNGEDGLNQPIPDRGDKQYMRMYFEIVHTIKESDDPSLIGFAMELWNRLDWPGCPTGANLIGDYDGYYFEPPTETFDLGGGWHQTYWVYDFSTDGSVGTQTFPDLHEATHTAALFGMLDEGDVTPFDMEEVYINYIWYNDADGSDIPIEDCVVLYESGKQPLIVDVNDIPVYEPKDTGGPPPAGPTDGQLQVSLAWPPGEGLGYPAFTATVVVDPDPNQEHVGSADFSFTKPVPPDPNGNVTLYFTQANWSQYQNVHVKATKDLLREGPETFKVEFTVTIDIADCNFGGPGCDPVTQTKGIKVVDNDIPFISAVPNAFALSEDDPCTPVCFNVRLSHLPTDDVYVLVVAEEWAFEEEMFIIDPSYEPATDPNKMKFTSGNYAVNQQICVYARDNDWLTEAWTQFIGGVVILTPYSEDVRYRVDWLQPDPYGFPIEVDDSGGEAEETIVNVLVEDNDCGSVGYPPYDVNEDCYVGLSEVATLYGQWLFCTDPYDDADACDKLWNF